MQCPRCEQDNSRAPSAVSSVRRRSHRRTRRPHALTADSSEVEAVGRPANSLTGTAMLLERTRRFQAPCGGAVVGVLFVRIGSLHRPYGASCTCCTGSEP
jgi:hypothetical protein